MTVALKRGLNLFLPESLLELGKQRQIRPLVPFRHLPQHRLRLVVVKAVFFMIRVVRAVSFSQGYYSKLSTRFLAGVADILEQSFFRLPNIVPCFRVVG